MVDEDKLTKIVEAVRHHGEMWRIFFEDYGEKTIPIDNNDTLYWWKISTEEFSIDDTNVNGKWWVDLSPDDREEYRRRVLHYPIVRKLTVYKDIKEKEELIKKENMKVCVEEREGSNEYRVHRKYEQDDTVLNEILRSERWTKHTDSKEYKKWGKLYRKRNALQDRFGEISPSYRASLALYITVSQMSRLDDTWVTFMKECSKLEKNSEHGGGGYGLTTDIDANDSERVDYVFCIPHTTCDRGNRDDSILSLAARRNPPLKVVELILELCRKSISHVDDPKWDYIPLNYAIINGASSKVVKALIPNEQDVAKFKSIRDFDFLNSRNLHYRTTLHCAAYFDAPIETIRVLREKCDEDVLSTLDHCQLTPLETAIWHGRSTQVIEEFFITGLKGSNTFEDVLAKLIRSMIYNESPFKERSICKHDPMCQTLTDTFDVNPTASERKRRVSPGSGLNPIDSSELPPPSIGDRKGVGGNQDPLEYGTKAKCTLDYDITSMSVSITKSKNLQNILSDKASHRFPTFVKLADLYLSILLIVSYRQCATHVFETGSDIKSTVFAYTLIGAAMYMALREYIELMGNNARWLLSPWNYLDVAMIGLVFYTFYRMWNLNPSDIQPGTESRSTFGHVTIVTTFFIWLQFIVILRSANKPFAILVSGSIRIGTLLIPFICGCFLILLAFGQMLTLQSFVMNSCESEASIDGRTLDQAEPNFCTFEGSTLGTFSYFIGNLEFDRLEESKWILIVFWLVGILILQNIVIAIVSKAWEQIGQISEEVFWEHRLSFLMTVKDYERVFTCGYNLSSENTSSFLKSFIAVRAKYKENSHDVLSKWLKFVWPGNYYVGNHESMLDRVFSTNVGSLRWQIMITFRRDNMNLFSRIVTFIRTFLLLIILFIMMVVLLISGLLTFGLLWPQQFRDFIFGYGLGGSDDNDGNLNERPLSRNGLDILTHRPSTSHSYI